MQPSDLRLPYPSWSPGQWDSLIELALSDTKYTVCEAPTGSGKSALAVALKRYVNDEWRLQVVTGTKQLQDQYADGLGLFKLMGRNNFPCLIEQGTTADRAPCTNGEKCELALSIKGSTPECGYYAQKHIGLEHKETVFNYSYWLAMQNYAHWPRAGLLVLDEAHLLEDEVRRFATLPLRESHVQLLRRKSTFTVHWPAIEMDVEGWQEWAYDIREGIDQEYFDLPKAAHTREEKAWRAAVNGVHTVVTGLLKYGVSDDSWVLQESPWGVDFLPVWVDEIAPEIVFNHADKVLLMSATILNKEMFCRQLGIPEDDCTFVQVPSVFEPKSRPLRILPGVRISAKNNNSLDGATKEIDRIITKHSGQNGLIHTGSYKIAQYLMEHSKHGKMGSNCLITHDSSDRARVISDFGSNPGSVLVSPSVTTGVDLPYDLCRFQIIAKIPFPDQADPQVKKRMKESAPGIPNPKGQSWYNWATLCNVIQAYGRGMRAADDSCETYMIDGNWKWFKHAVSEMIPAWVKEALIYEKETGNSMEDYLAQLR